MLTGTFKLKDGTDLVIHDKSVVVTIDGTQYLLSDVIDALETFRKSMIGTPRYWRHTELPANHCWANGDLVYFEDWPELKEVYDEGSIMVLSYEFLSLQSYLPGYWYLNADSTGLYTPNLDSQFLRSYVGSNLIAGAANSAGLPNITGSFRNLILQIMDVKQISCSGAFSFPSHIDDALFSLADSSYQTQVNDNDGLVFNASSSNSIYGSSSTVMPASVNVPVIIYLGASS